MYKFLTLSLFSLSLSASVYNGVAIVVQNKAITMYEIKQEMKISKVSAKQASETLIREKLEEIETHKRGISIGSEEVYAEVKKMASANNLSVSDFYTAIMENQGVSSDDLKKKVRAKLLSQKLYNDIAYSSMTRPTDTDIQEYYKIHKEKFEHPSAFVVDIYLSKEIGRLQEKVNNPMFYSPDISMHEERLEYGKIPPALAELLNKTQEGSFSQIVPNEGGAYMTFYVKKRESTKVSSDISAYKNEIMNEMISSQREKILTDYFAKLQHNASINTIRLPK